MLETPVASARPLPRATLALECSTPRGSIAARSGGSLVFSEAFTAARGHGAVLFEVLERALKALGKCDQVAVGIGPGSYSGVRIAIAAAIGLELARGCDLLGIPSIATLEAGSYFVTGDARREEFFLARVEAGVVTEGPSLLPLAELPARLASAGPLPIFSSAPIDALPTLRIAFPSAENLALMAEQGRGIAATGSLEPLYLRDPHITQPGRRAGR